MIQRIPPSLELRWMRAIVTGATGFLGSHLVRLLLAHDDAVAVVLRRQSDAWRLREVADRLCILDADDADLAAQASRFGPETMFHLAWSGVHGTGRDETQHVGDNLRRTAGVVDLAQRTGCRVILGLGSQAEFGPSSSVLDEDTPCRPRTAYGVGKLAAGLMVANTTGGMRGAWLRLLSAYGPMDHPSYLVPYVITELLAGRRPRLSSGVQPHDTLYCLDVAAALRAAATSDRCRGIYVLAAGGDVTVRDIARTVCELVGPGAAVDLGAPSCHPGWRASRRRLTEDTGWSPSTALRVGLAETVLWYRQNGDTP